MRPFRSTAVLLLALGVVGLPTPALAGGGPDRPEPVVSVVAVDADTGQLIAPSTAEQTSRTGGPESFSTASISATPTSGIVGTVTGTSNSGTTGPLAGICVAAYDAAFAFFPADSQTDAAGRYSISGLPDGSYRVNFSDCNAPGIWAGEWHVDKPTPTGATAMPVLASNGPTTVDADLVPGGKVTIFMTTPQAAPAAGVCVGLHQYNANDQRQLTYVTRTNEQGVASINGLPTDPTYRLELAGTQSFCPTGSPYPTEWYEDQPTEAQATQIFAIADEDLNIEVTIGGSVVTVPDAPTAVTAGPTSATTANVSFSPGSDGGSAITSYTAFCLSTDGGINRGQTGPTSPLTVTGLSAAKTYQCRARATNAVGAGPYSAYTPTFVQPAATAPAVPTGVSATPVTSTTARVAFAPPVDDGGNPITSYTAFCLSTDGGTNRGQTGPTGPLTVTGLSAAKTYQCRARATNAVGAGPYSAYTPTFVQPAGAAPGVPTGVSAEPLTSTTARVAFTPPVDDGGSPITSYTAFCLSTDGGTNRAVSGTASPLTVTGMSAAKTYKCRARATNAIGIGAYSAYTSTFLLPASAPSAPTAVSAAPTSPTTAQVSFSPPVSDGGSAITGYTAFCLSTDGGINRGQSGTTSPITVSGMSSGKSYKCRVRATNALGAGSYSAYTGVFLQP